MCAPPPLQSMISKKLLEQDKQRATKILQSFYTPTKPITVPKKVAG